MLLRANSGSKTSFTECTEVEKKSCRIFFFFSQRNYLTCISEMILKRGGDGPGFIIDGHKLKWYCFDGGPRKKTGWTCSQRMQVASCILRTSNSCLCIGKAKNVLWIWVILLYCSDLEKHFLNISALFVSISYIISYMARNVGQSTLEMKKRLQVSDIWFYRRKLIKLNYKTTISLNEEEIAKNS